MSSTWKKSYEEWREFAHEIVFIGLSRVGKTFEVLLVTAIVASVAVVMIDSIAPARTRFAGLLYSLEWVFTIAFTLEYALRMWCTDRKYWYARSFYGLVDLLAILPTYLSLLFPGTQYLLVIRVVEDHQGLGTLGEKLNVYERRLLRKQDRKALLGDSQEDQARTDQDEIRADREEDTTAPVLDLAPGGGTAKGVRCPWLWIGVVVHGFVTPGGIC